MNCKQGDMAIYIKSSAGNEGQIVHCLRLATSEEIKAVKFPMEPVWIIDRPMLTNWGNMIPLAQDKKLRPIRDPGEDAQDETLSWLPVPFKEHA